MNTKPPEYESFRPIAAILAWVAPGAGYLALRQPLRAAYAFVGVMGLIVSGTLIGGISVIDSEENRWWYLPQMGAGPIVLGANAYHQEVLKPALKSSNADIAAGDPVPFERSVSRVNETGTLFVAVAGMLNIIIVIDCSMSAAGRRRGAAP